MTVDELIRGSLHDTAATTPVIDGLAEAAIRQGRRRRRVRRLGIASGPLLVAVLVGVVAAIVASTGHSALPRPGRQTLNESPTTSPQATVSVTPSYLPDGAWIASTQRITGPPVALPPDPTPSELWAWINQQDTDTIGLSGAANANNLPNKALATQAGQGPTGGGAAVHGATTIAVTFIPSDLPGVAPTIVPRHNDINTSQVVTIAGNQALLTYPVGGDSGTYNVAWNDADGYHSVEVERIDTTDGLSGVPAATLLRIAESLYPH